MVSEGFFTFELEGKTFSDLSANIKQPVGSSFESTNLEISPPQGYKGPIDYNAFREAVEKYYRNLDGGTDSGINIQGGSNIRMRNNTFIKESVVTIDVDSKGAGW